MINNRTDAWNTDVNLLICCFLCQDVSKQLWSTLYDFPELQNCTKLKEYMDECVRLSWMMAVQIPPMIIEYEATVFSDKLHGRFMTSDMKSLAIKYHVWPALIDSQGSHVLYRGVVVTWLIHTYIELQNSSRETSQLTCTLSVFIFNTYSSREISLKRTRNLQNEWEIRPALVGVAVDATVAVSLRTCASPKKRHLLPLGLSLEFLKKHRCHFTMEVSPLLNIPSRNSLLKGKFIELKRAKKTYIKHI